MKTVTISIVSQNYFYVDNMDTGVATIEGPENVEMEKVVKNVGVAMNILGMK